MVAFPLDVAADGRPGLDVAGCNGGVAVWNGAVWLDVLGDVLVGLDVAGLNGILNQTWLGMALWA